MTTAAQVFYGTTSLRGCTREDVLAGRAIKINPALVTLTDGQIDQVAPVVLQQRIWEHVVDLLAFKIRTFHVDLNFHDYSGYGDERPQSNLAIFTPAFLERLNALMTSSGAFLNLHLLTDFPQRHLDQLARVAPGAICFQLEALESPRHVEQLINRIHALGAGASPVVETVGSEQLRPLSPDQAGDLLRPFLPNLEMVTFQAAGTASRSNRPQGDFAKEAVAAYLPVLREGYSGTVQIQGGITTETIGAAVELGAEFLVCGTQLFRNRERISPRVVIDALLKEAADALHI
jgi:pentose-5-phosphate-3-epimerase